MQTEILYQHYVETCALTREAERNRSNYMIKSIIALAIFLLLFIDEITSKRLADIIFEKNFAAEFPISLNIIKIVAIIIYAYYYISYFQKCMFIERQYLYTYQLECSLEKEGIEIIREGKNYNIEQPTLLKLIGWFYKFVLPIGSILSLFYVLFITVKQISVTWTICLFVSILLLLITIGYMRFQFLTEKQY